MFEAEAQSRERSTLANHLTSRERFSGICRQSCRRSCRRSQRNCSEIFKNTCLCIRRNSYRAVWLGLEGVEGLGVGFGIQFRGSEVDRCG